MRPYPDARAEQPPRGAVLFSNPDGTLSGRFSSDLLDVVAEYDQATQTVYVRYRLSGYNTFWGENPLQFPFTPGAPELVCQTDPTLVLVATGHDKAPFRLCRQVGAPVGNAPW